MMIRRYSTRSVECLLIIISYLLTDMGLKLIQGQSVGDATINCGNTGAMCYNMTASAAVVLDVVKAGCSLWRCMLARDRCISTTFQNVPISLCCCSSDRCNVGENYGMKQVGGFNAAPDHEENLTREKVAQAFSAMEVDDDMPSSTSRGHRHGASSTGSDGSSTGNWGSTGSRSSSRGSSRTHPTHSTSPQASTDEVEIP